MNEDFVDILLGQWGAELPGVDFEPLGVFARLARFSRLASRSIYANIEQFDLNETQFNMLAALHRVGPPYQLTPKDLSTRMLLTSGAMTYIIDQMEKAGHVVRHANGRDRRSSQIELTAQGRQVIEDAVRSHIGVCRELLSPLSDTRRKEFIRTLRALLLYVDSGPMPVARTDAGG